MFILRLDPPLPVTTPKGPALAILFRDYGCEYDDLWTCVDLNGEFWTWPNHQVRAQKNITMGRVNVEPPVPFYQENLMFNITSDQVGGLFRHAAGSGIAYAVAKGYIPVGDYPEAVAFVSWVGVSAWSAFTNRAGKIVK